MATETAVRRAAYGKMAGDGTLTGLLGPPATGFSQSIYHEEAPPNAGYPFIVFHKQAGTPTYTFKQGSSAFETDVWLIKAVDRNTSADAAEAVASRLRALLTDGALTISGATQMYLRRDSDIPSYQEVRDGVQYRHVGSLWRLIFQ